MSPRKKGKSTGKKSGESPAAVELCGKCNNDLQQGGSGGNTQCSFCRLWYHDECMFSCSSAQLTQLRKLASNSALTGQVSYFCQSCKPDEIFSRAKETALLGKRLADLEKKLEAKSFEPTADVLKSLTDKIEQISGEVSRLSLRPAAAASSGSCQLDLFDPAVAAPLRALMRDVMDEDRRASFAILKGLPDADDLAADKKFVSDCAAKMGIAAAKVKLDTISRIGAFAPTTTRLLRVGFDSKDTKRQYINGHREKECGKITQPNSSSVKYVVCHPDLTKGQRDLAGVLDQQLEDAKRGLPRNGADLLYADYARGVIARRTPSEGQIDDIIYRVRVNAARRLPNPAEWVPSTRRNPPTGGQSATPSVSPATPKGGGVQNHAATGAPRYASNRGGDGANGRGGGGCGGYGSGYGGSGRSSAGTRGGGGGGGGERNNGGGAYGNGPSRGAYHGALGGQQYGYGAGSQQRRQGGNNYNSQSGGGGHARRAPQQQQRF